MKTATKKTTKKPATEPSADASPAHKNRIATARKNRGKPPVEEAPAAAPAPDEQDDFGPATPADADAPDLDDGAVVINETEYLTEPATEATEAPPNAGDAPFATLNDLGATWIEYLKANGATTSTWSGYARDIDVAVEFFGPLVTADLAMITPERIASFEESDAVTKKKNGAPRAMPTILKTRRVLRLAFAWAKDAGRLATALPYAKKAGAA